MKLPIDCIFSKTKNCKNLKICPFPKTKKKCKNPNLKPPDRYGSPEGSELQASMNLPFTNNQNLRNVSIEGYSGMHTPFGYSMYLLPAFYMTMDLETEVHKTGWIPQEIHEKVPKMGVCCS